MPDPGRPGGCWRSSIAGVCPQVRAGFCDVVDNPALFWKKRMARAQARSWTRLGERAHLRCNNAGKKEGSMSRSKAVVMLAVCLVFCLSFFAGPSADPLQAQQSSSRSCPRGMKGAVMFCGSVKARHGCKIVIDVLSETSSSPRGTWSRACRMLQAGAIDLPSAPRSI